MQNFALRNIRVEVIIHFIELFRRMFFFRQEIIDNNWKGKKGQT